MKIVLKEVIREQRKVLGGKAYLLEIITKDQTFSFLISNELYFSKLPVEVEIGEPIGESSFGAIDYSSGIHETVSGNFQFPEVFFVKKKLNDDTQYDPFELQYEASLTDYEKVDFMRKLNKNMKDILLKIEKESYRTNYGDLGPYLEYWPLIATYRKSTLFDVPLNAGVRWYMNSFQAEFLWDELAVHVPKAKPKVTSSDLYIQIDIGKVRIYYNELFNRKIVYRTTRTSNVLLGFEQYQNYIHAPALIRKDHRFWFNEVFYWRLGDISFIPLDLDELCKNELDPEDRVIKYLMEDRKRVTEIQLEKVKILLGELKERDGYFYAYNDEQSVIAYHPEHGVIELPAGEYVLLQPNYIRKGHD